MMEFKGEEHMAPEMEPTGRDLVIRRSPYDFADTLTRLKNQVVAHGARIFAVIDHAAGAERAGLRMPPTTVVIFGDAAVGTPIMLEAPDLALDLPSRVLVRQADNVVEVVYTPPAALAARYGVVAGKVAGLSGLTKMIDDAFEG